MKKDEKNEKLPEQAGWIAIYPPPKQIPAGPHSLHDMAYHSEADQLYSAITRIIDVVEHETAYGSSHHRRVLAEDITGILEEELRLEP